MRILKSERTPEEIFGQDTRFARMFNELSDVEALNTVTDPQGFFSKILINMNGIYYHISNFQVRDGKRFFILEPIAE